MKVHPHIHLPSEICAAAALITRVKREMDVLQSGSGPTGTVKLVKIQAWDVSGIELEHHYEGHYVHVAPGSKLSPGARVPDADLAIFAAILFPV